MALVAAMLSLIACGGGGNSATAGPSTKLKPVVEVPNESLVTVQGVAIRGSELRHWMGIMSNGLVIDTPSFSACVRFERKASDQRHESDEMLLAKCHKDYEALRRRTLRFLIAAQWLLAEAAYDGHSVTISDIDARYDRTLRESYPGGRGELREALEESGQTVADLRFRAAVEVAAERIHRKLTAGESPVTEAQVASYYRAHKDRFLVPEIRSIEIVERYTKAAAIKAKGEIEHGRNIMTLEPLAETFKSDQRGHRLIFTAKPHTLVGPAKLPASWSVFEVVRASPPKYEPLTNVVVRIHEDLSEAERRTSLARFIRALTARWAPRTSCKPGFVVPACSAYRGSRATAVGDPFTLF
jgi:hypothetical protein